MLNKQQRLAQKKLEARLQAEKNAEKSKHCIKAGVNLPSQWGRVVTNEQRLIDNGHFMKGADRANLDSKREEYKDTKIAQKHGMAFEEYRHAKRFGLLPKTVNRVERH